MNAGSARRRRPRLIAALLAASCLAPLGAHADDTWLAAPGTNNYNTAGNWAGNTVPTAGATAIFGASNTTNLTITSNVSPGTLQFDAGAPAYSFVVNPGIELQLIGAGIVNNSSNAPSISATGSAVKLSGAAALGNAAVSLGAGSSLVLSGNASGGTASVTGTANAIIDISALTSGGTTLGALSGTGVVDLGSNQLAVGSNNSTTSYDGFISGSGNLVKQGSGKLTLTGANNYFGGTSINGGTLAVLTNSSLGFAASPLRFDGGTLQLLGNSFQTVQRAVTLDAGGGTIDTNGFRLALGTPIGGVGGLTKTGQGTLELSGSSTYGGDTTILGGALRFNQSAPPGNVVNNGQLILTTNNSLSAAGVISGTGSLLTSGGTVTLTGANTYSGGTTVSGGALKGTTASVQGNIVLDFGSVIFDQATAGTYSGTISGTGGVTKLGSGTLIVAGTNTYSGSTTISAGTLQVGSSGAPGSLGSSRVINNANLVVSNGSVSNLIENGLAGSLTFQNASTAGTSTISRGIVRFEDSSSAASSRISIDGVGNGSLLFTGSSSAGNAIIGMDDSSIVFQGNATGGNAQISIGGLTTFDISGLSTSGLSLGYLDGGGTVNLGSKQLSIGSSNISMSVWGDISGAGGSLVKTGSDWLTLDGRNTYTGGTIVSGGTLKGSPTSLQGDILNNSAVVLASSTGGTFASTMSGSGSLTLEFAGSLTLTGNNSYSGGTTLSFGTLRGTTTSLQGNILNDNATVTFDQASAGTYAGNMSGSGRLTVEGGGTLTLTGNNTFTGGTTIGPGTLRLGAGGSLAASGALAINGGTFDLNGQNQTVGALSGSGGTILLAGGRLTAGDASNTTLAASIIGSGSFVKQGSGALTLSGSNTYTGDTTVSSGRLQGNTVSLQGNVDIDVNGRLVFDQATAGTFGGVISGDGGVTLTGNGTVTLTAANTYTGGTHLEPGRLRLGVAGALASTGVVSFNGGTLDLGGNDQTIGGLAGNGGTIELGSNRLTVNQAIDTTFDGWIVGAGGLTKSGSGTLTFTGFATHTGGTEVLGGMLRSTAAFMPTNIVVGGGGRVAFGQEFGLFGNYAGNISGSGSVIVEVGSRVRFVTPNSYTGGTFVEGTLQGTTETLRGNIVGGGGSVWFNQDSNGTFAGTISGSVFLVKLGSGWVTLTGTNTYTGVTLVSSGRLQGSSSSLQGDIVTEAEVRFIQAADGTYAGAMSGTGSLIKSGAGTLILTGTNSHTGGTLVEEGILQGTTSTLRGNIANNGRVVFDQATAGIYSGNMSGGGSLTKSSVGTLVLAGNNTYTGGTIVSAGTLQGSSTGLQGAIANDATVVFDQSTAGSYGGNMSGTGSLIKQGTGQLVLAGANTFSGGTTVNDGILRLSSSAGLLAGSTLTINGGTFDLNGNNLAVGTLSSTGGAIALGQGILTTSSDTSTTITAPISGTGGFVKQGAGTLTLAGNSTYTGGTTVNAGTLALGGGLASGVVVNSGGTFILNGSVAGGIIVNGGGGLLAGNGSVASGITINAGGALTTSGNLAGAVTVNSGAVAGNGSLTSLVSNGSILMPGNSIGTLTVTGSFTQNGGIYQVEANSAGQSDRIAVGGRATINGGTVQVLAQPGTYARNASYTILNAAGGISGSYAGVTSNFAFLVPSLSYDANNVYLLLAQSSSAFASGARTGNQFVVGSVLDRANSSATGDFNNVLNAFSVLSTTQGPAALNAISGQNYSGFSSSMVQGAQLFMSNFASQAGGGSRSGNKVALAEACDVACDDAAPATWGAWGGALGGLGTIAGNSNAGTLTYNAGGFAAGLDRRLTPNLLAGVTVGYTTGSQWVGGFSGKGMSDTFTAGVYGSYGDGPLYVDGLAGYAYSANQMWRTIAIPGLLPRTAQGFTGANQFYGQVEAGYRFDLGVEDTFVTPFARLQGYTGTQNAFSETGAQSLDLDVARQTTDSLRSVIGAQLGGASDVGWRDKLTAQLRLGWSHEFASTARPVTASFAGAPTIPFTTYGASPQRDGVLIGFSAGTAIAEATSLYLRYEGTIAGQDSSHALSAGVRMTW